MTNSRRPAAAGSLTAIEHAIINAALEFANLPQIESVDQVLGIFMPVAEGTQSPLFQTILDRDVGAFVDDRAQLLEWLDTIGRRRPGEADRENIWGNLRVVLNDTVRGDAIWALTPQGTLSSSARPLLAGVQACTAFAAALLLDRNRRLHRWLQQCELPECRRWFFAWGTDGAPRKSCCPAHDSPQPAQ